MRHKFYAKPINVGGIHFDSKKEARYHQELELRQKAGDVVFFLRQVPFYMPNVKYVLDFMVFEASGQIRFIDVKGFRTKIYKRKKKLVEKYFPITIEER